MTAKATRLARPLSDRMQAARDLPNGARFYRCALQVNPFAYLARHNKMTTFTSEDDYNKAIIESCLENGIEVIAVTDHYRVQHSASLVRAARDAGLYAFSGFEAVTKDGVHFLCLFDPDKDDVLERFIGECGIHDTDQPSPTGRKDAIELLACAKSWGAVCIAAHVASRGGLLKTLSGQSRINVWTHPDLLACALPGPVSAAPDGIRPILENKNADYRRDRIPAILNASDVNDPEDLKKNSASCFIKMSTVSVEAFRQAFLDPTSRIRLHSDPQPEPHAEFLAMTWEGGFLCDTAVHLNENLNVLVGGRGTGKSTMIESIRYALGLGPLGEEARKAHEGVIRHVLKSGTKISLLVRSHKPSERCYTIERSVPNPPVVKDEAGEVLTLSPRDVMPGVEVFGQHEISELTRSPEKLTLLLERFVDRDPSLSGQKSKVRMELERSRNRIVDVRREMKRLDERLAALPGLEETQKRFQQAGLEERLKEKSLLIREERLFAKALGEANRVIAQTKSRWNERKTKIEDTYEKLLRELQKSKIDGAQFIQLRQQIEELRPLKDKTDNLKRDLKAHEAQRRNLLAEWEDIKAAEYRQIETAAKRVSRKLRQADPDLFMRIEELELPATTEIGLNTAPDGETADWQTLQALSTGQKATAVLLLLLLESKAPLVVDQPEDDLDNRFITEGVVPIMRQEKRRRQFIFSTHNANIPVLGDAELILGLAASGEAREGHARIATEHMGSIDSAPVRELVEEILEGGKAAFEMRRSKYGF